MPKMIFVNLPVADVEKSVAFYEAIGFIKDERFSQPGSAGAMVWSDTIVFMILKHARFADFTSKRIVDAKNEIEALLCLSLDSRQGIDAIVEKAVLAGGKADPGPNQDHGDRRRPALCLSAKDAADSHRGSARGGSASSNRVTSAHPRLSRQQPPHRIQRARDIPSLS
jgi:predicted lactoylglutathione lyase